MNAAIRRGGPGDARAAVHGDVDRERASVGEDARGPDIERRESKRFSGQDRLGRVGRKAIGRVDAGSVDGAPDRAGSDLDEGCRIAALGEDCGLVDLAWALLELACLAGAARDRVAAELGGAHAVEGVAALAEVAACVVGAGAGAPARDAALAGRALGIGAARGGAAFSSADAAPSARCDA